MTRKRIEDTGQAGTATRAATGVTYYVKVPLSLAERIEDEIHARTKEHLRERGRADASASAFFREAGEVLLDQCEARRGKAENLAVVAKKKG